jgi:hypothetical protein
MRIGAKERHQSILTILKAAGFNWYVNSQFPVQPNWIDSGLSHPNVAPSNSFSVSNGVMTYTPRVSGGIFGCVWNGSKIIGNSYGNGFFIDFTYSFNPALSYNTSETWPTVWFLPIEFLNGGSGTSGHVIDTSIVEAYPVNGVRLCNNNCQLLAGTHDEQQGQTSNPPQYIRDMAADALPSMFGTINELHHYQFLWVPMAQNGGTGLMQWYVDNILQLSITYTSTGFSNPPLSPSAGNGELSYADSQHFCMIIQNGAPTTNQTMNIGTFQIWQLP